MFKLMPVIWISLGVCFLLLARKFQVKDKAWWKLAGTTFIFVGCADLLELFLKDKMVEYGFYAQFLLLNILVISLFVVALIVVGLTVRRNKRDSKNVQDI